MEIPKAIIINRTNLLSVTIILVIFSMILIFLGILIGDTNDNRGLYKKTPWVYDDIIRMQYTCYLLISIGICGGLIFQGFPLTSRHNTEIFIDENDLI